MNDVKVALRRTSRSIALLLVVMALALAAVGAPVAGAQGRLKVVASFSVLGDFVQNVGGDLVDVAVLVPAGGDPHTFEPSPADSIALNEAALVFEIGLEFETWLDNLYAASGSGALRVPLAEGLDLLADGHGHADDDHDADDHEGEAHEDDHAHGEYDPHVWHDVQNAIHMVGVIRDALAEADPANAEAYRANAEAYIAELEALDAFILEQVAAVPEANRILFTSHEAFGYFGARYGFAVDSVLGITTESADPSASQIAAIIDAIRESGVPAIFAENAVNPRLIEQIAREAGVTLGGALYDVLGEPGTPGDTYVGMIRHNATTISEALR